MPGTPATTPRYALPRYANADAADFAGSVNPIVDRIAAVVGTVADTYTNRPAAATALNDLRFFATDKAMEWQCIAGAWVLVNVWAPEVTSLPTSPIDQQECIYIADTANGVKWHLRYRAASASAYKWEYVGGGSLTAESQVLTSTSNSSYSLLASPPTISTPLAGDYLIEHGCQCQNNVVDGVAIQTVKLGTTASGDGESTVHVSSTAAAQGTPAKKFRRSFAASANLHTEHRTSGAGTATFVRQWLNVTPVRLG